MSLHYAIMDVRKQIDRRAEMKNTYRILARNNAGNIAEFVIESTKKELKVQVDALFAAGFVSIVCCKLSLN